MPETDADLTRRTFLAGAATTGAVAAAGCTSNNTSTEDSGTLSGDIGVAGSSTVFPLSVAMRRRFVEDHGKVDISVQSTGSGGGFANYFCPGDTDFNNASRPIKPEEEEQCSGNDITPVELKVATDALTVVVNPEADWFGEDDCITVEDLHQIWSAESKPMTWQEVNSDWPDEEIELFGPTDASGTFDYFNETILGEETNHRTDYQSTEQDNQIINGVNRSEYAIGYLGFAYYSENKDQVTALAVDNGDGCVKPTLENAKSGEYAPLSRPLFTYVSQSSLTKDQVVEFAKFWVENTTDQAIVADEVGYVPNSEAEMEEAMSTLEDAIETAQN